MKLICNICGNHETSTSWMVGEDCYLGCGGVFIEHVTTVEHVQEDLAQHDSVIKLCKIDDMLYDEGQEEIDPTGRDQHAPGAKMDDGKVKAGILEDFSLALWEVARVGSNGSVKYTRRGWETVPNGIERYNDAKWRHLLKGVREPLDPEWNILHLAHEAWNCLAKLELMLREIPKEG